MATRRLVLTATSASSRATRLTSVPSEYESGASTHRKRRGLAPVVGTGCRRTAVIDARAQSWAGMIAQARSRPAFVAMNKLGGKCRGPYTGPPTAGPSGRIFQGRLPARGRGDAARTVSPPSRRAGLPGNEDETTSAKQAWGGCRRRSRLRARASRPFP
jgi:hypothetical protein